MTHYILKLSLTAAFIFVCMSPSAQLMEAKEYAAELDRTEFGTAPTKNGLIFVRRCDQCPELGVTFKAQTQYLDGDRIITAKAAEGLFDRGATVLFDPTSRSVTRVIFWPAN